jgi:hypothetical protein
MCTSPRPFLSLLKMKLLIREPFIMDTVRSREPWICQGKGWEIGVLPHLDFISLNNGGSVVWLFG